MSDLAANAAAASRGRRLPRALLSQAVIDLHPPDEECRLLMHRGIKAIGASVIGPSHRLSSTVRQDSFDLRAIGNFVVAIAADGLGSAEFSQAASRFATRRAGQRISRALAALTEAAGAHEVERVVRQEVFELAGIFQDAEARGAPGPMYTTILGAICGPEYLVIFNFGDGAVASFDCSGGSFTEHEYLGPEHGDYVGEVYPLLLEGFEEHFRITTSDLAERVLVATDGAADFIISDDETGVKAEFAVGFDTALRSIASVQAPREVASYLAGERASAVNADDKTLLWLEL